MANTRIDGYDYYNEELDSSHAYLLPTVVKALGRPSLDVKVFDLGCGNGLVTAEIARLGWTVCGVDPSQSGVAQANKDRPTIPIYEASAYDDLSSRFGKFDFAISLEVVEHLYAPREWAATLYDLLEPGGLAIVSTPYHSYIKNLAMALTGKLDSHFTALWDHGHIKFWSTKTLTILLEESGFEILRFERVGRIPQLAKSMIAIARKPH